MTLPTGVTYNTALMTRTWIIQCPVNGELKILTTTVSKKLKASQVLTSTRFNWIDTRGHIRPNIRRAEFKSFFETQKQQAQEENHG